MSPGSLPIHGIFSPIKRRTPMAIIKTPRRMRIFPKGPDFKFIPKTPQPPLIRGGITSYDIWIPNQVRDDKQGTNRCLTNSVHAELVSASRFFTLFVFMNTFPFHCKCTHSIAGGRVPSPLRLPLPSSNPAGNLHNRMESQPRWQCVPRFL